LKFENATPSERRSIGLFSRFGLCGKEINMPAQPTIWVREGQRLAARPLPVMANRKKKHSRREPCRRGGDEFPKRSAGVRACGLRRRPTASWEKIRSPQVTFNCATLGVQSYAVRSPVASDFRARLLASQPSKWDLMDAL
jgi:hypothetical protein